MNERELTQALINAAITAVTPSGLPIKVPMRNFSVPNDQRYWEVLIIPNNISSQYWDESRTFQGLMRLILHWRIDDAGPYPPMDNVQIVSDWFTKDKQQNGLHFYDKPQFLGSQESGQEALFPLSIAYRCFAPD